MKGKDDKEKDLALEMKTLTLSILWHHKDQAKKQNDCCLDYISNPRSLPQTDRYDVAIYLGIC